jgi:hypothetical protein
MSIFDRTSGMNAVPWLQEKSLACLGDAARLVDLANEPDTAPWYAKEVRRRAAGLIGRLAPMVALFYDSGEAAAATKEWEGIAERGSFALAAWCRRHDVADPNAKAFNLLARERTADEAAEKGELPSEHALEGDGSEEAESRRDDLRLFLYSLMTRRLVHEPLPDPARRLLLWALSHLHVSDLPDTVALSKRFLPTDIDASDAETAQAYRLLCERGYFERVARAGGSPDALLVRLVGEGLNESKQPPEFVEENFGYPGSRIGGKPTCGTEVKVELPATLTSVVQKWAWTAEDHEALRASVQEKLGRDCAYVEGVDMARTTGTVTVRLRFPLDESESSVRGGVHAATVEWLRRRLAPPA